MFLELVTRLETNLDIIFSQNISPSDLAAATEAIDEEIDAAVKDNKEVAAGD